MVDDGELPKTECGGRLSGIFKLGPRYLRVLTTDQTQRVNVRVNGESFILFVVQSLTIKKLLT